MKIVNNTHYHQETPDKIIEVLEALRVSGRHVRIFCGDMQTGRSWNEECEVIGTIGRSTGERKVPLLVPPGGNGGLAILTHCIIRVDTPRKTLYTHPNFHVGSIQVVKGEPTSACWDVYIDKHIHASFPTKKVATSYVSFLEGNRFSPIE